jgi:hypothetical protein
MKSKVFIFFKVICVTILFISCRPKYDYSKIAEGIVVSNSFVRIDNPDVVTINNEKAEKLPYGKFADMIEDFRYIPLISKEPIGVFEKILIHKERIYVLDAYIAKKIFIFDMKGEIIKVIDNRGRGPKEYTGLMDMTISLEDDYLVINDRLAPFILYFTLDGEFVKKTRNIFNSSLEIVNRKVLNQLNTGQSFDNDVNYLLVVTDGDSIIRKGFPHYPIQHDALFYYSFYHNYKNELLFCPFYCDTIYQIINDSAYTIRYIVKQKKSFWERSNQKLDVANWGDFRLIKNENYTVLSRPVLETEHFIYYPIKAKRSRDDGYIGVSDYYYWYDKNKEISFTFDEGYGEPIYHPIIPVNAMYNNYFAGIIEPEGVEYHRSRIKETADAIYKNREFRDIFLNTTNPDLEGILMLYKFKSEW